MRCASITAATRQHLHNVWILLVARLFPRNPLSFLLHSPVQVQATASALVACRARAGISGVAGEICSGSLTWWITFPFRKGRMVSSLALTIADYLRFSVLQFMFWTPPLETCR